MTATERAKEYMERYADNQHVSTGDAWSIIRDLLEERGLDVVDWDDKLIQETAEECAGIAESTPGGEYAGYQIASDIRRRFGDITA